MSCNDQDFDKMHLFNQKNFQNTKFNVSNYMYLTNNFFTFSSCLNLLIANKIKPTNLLKIKIKKNKYFFYKMYSQFRHFFFNKNYLFNHFLKFNKYLNFNLHIACKNKKIINYSYLPKNYMFTFNTLYKKKFLKNWNYLIGSPISPYNWELYSNKKLFRKNLNLLYIKNNLYFSNINKKNKHFNNTIIFKKIFINNFFYLKKNKINYNNLNFLLKNKPTYKIKTTYNWFFSKPYFFLNINDTFKLSTYYPNYFTFSLYKNYFKLFNVIKKFKFRYKYKNKFQYKTKIKNKTDFIFKNKLFKNKFFFKFSNNFVHNVFQSFKKTPAVFTYKKLNKTSINSKKIFNTKKINRYLRINFISKTRILKKNKTMLSLCLNRTFNISFNIFFVTLKLLRLSRRIKKINYWSKIFNVLKLKNSFLPSWYKKTFNFNIYNAINYFYKNKLKKLYQYKCHFKFNSLFLKNLKSTKYYNRTLAKINRIGKAGKTNKYSFLNNKLYFTTKEKTFFTSNKYGFLFINDFLLFSFYKEKFFYNLKKTHYSFPYKNEVQRYILKKYTKFSFINNYFNSDLPLTTNNAHDSIKNYTFNNFYESFSKKNNSIFFILNKKLYSSSKWTYLNNQLNYTKNFIKEDFNLNIKRVKFKPGYMNLWRESRTILKNTLSISFKYQHRLTKYLAKYNKFIKFKTFLILEMSLLNILIKTKFFPDESLCKLFLKNNLIYLNGYICFNETIQIFIGDFIQLIINIKYYILYKWFLNLSFKKKNRLKKVLKKKIYVSFDLEEKKKSQNLPNWIFFSKNSIDDVSKYIEVDYFTLSAIILYEPFLWSDISIYNLIYYRFGVINLYNWKYIT